MLSKALVQWARDHCVTDLGADNERGSEQQIAEASLLRALAAGNAKAVFDLQDRHQGILNGTAG